MLFSSWLRYWKRSLERQSSRKQTRRRKSPVRRVVPQPRLEALEDRTLLSAYVVTTTADSGAGSLRDAINQINADTSHALYASLSNPNVDEIDFNITAASDAASGGTGYNATTGVATFKTGSALPAIYNAVVINGYTQAGASQNTLLGASTLGSTDSTLHPENYGDNAMLKVELDGESAGTANGLDLEADNVTVQGLVINRFANHGISANGNGDVIQGNFLGTDVTGKQALGNYLDDVAVHQVNDTIGGTAAAARNIISGSLNGGGIDLSFSLHTVVQGNFIGTDVTGRNSLGNATGGIGGLANNHLIGGSIAGAGNVISGNGDIGVVEDPYASPNVIEGNFIGTDVTGTKAVGNPNGVWLAGGDGDILGGTSPGDGNLISGNGGIGIRGFRSNNAIQGNLIGTDVTGTKHLGNGGIGIDFQDGGNNNLIGGLDTNAPGQPLAGGGNVITDGMTLDVSDSVIEGNYIGTDIKGTTTISGGGVGLGNSASYNTIGGTTAAARNIISGQNGAWGADIDIGDESGGTGVNLPSNNLVEGNYIGTDATGTVVLGNGNGVSLHGAINNTIGGTVSGAGNLIMGGQYAGEISGHGVFLWSDGSPNDPNNGNVVQGNTIKGNWEGMFVSDGTGNAIGGSASGAGNVISDNANGGLYLGSAGNFVEGNNILTNTGNGVTVYTSNNTLGGTATGAGNIISGNGGDGVVVANGATGVPIRGNSIHDNGSLGIDLGGSGVPVLNDSQGHTGPNNFQDFPILTSAITNKGGVTIIAGSFNSPSQPNTAITVDFYANQTADPSGYGEGQIYLGSMTFTTNSSGVYTIRSFKPSVTVPVGYYVTATATDSAGNTSEFGPDVRAAAPGNSGSRGLLVGASDTSGSGGTGGALVPEALGVYVDNSTGSFTTDELARVADALAGVNAVVGPYGASLTEINSSATADVTIQLGTTTPLGGLADGVLGCEDTSGITLVQGWNWYAGSDATQIGLGQYDFETVLVHELGHALGLGHSTDAASVMYPTLNAGVANRALQVADLNVPDSNSGACGLHAAPTATVSNPSNSQGVSVPSNPSIPSSGSPLSVADQLLADLALLLSDARNAYQSELSSMSALWQSVDALALQRLDALLSMEAGAMGVTKDILMRDLLFANWLSPKGV